MITKRKLKDCIISLLLSFMMMVAFVPMLDAAVYADTGDGVISAGDDMIWSWWTSPQVVSAGDKVFWGFTNSAKKVGVACYDKNTGEITKTIFESAYSSGDTNGVALALTSDNRLMCAYATGKNSAGTLAQKVMHVQVSTEPLSIDEFTDSITTTANTASFAQLLESNGTYYVFYRTNTTGSWAYMKSSDQGATWTRSSKVLIKETALQYYCRFVPTTDPSLFRVLLCSDPTLSAPEIREGFFNTTNDSLYDATDLDTSVGSAEVAYTKFTVLQDVEEGKTQRLLDAAVTAPNDPRFLFASFTNKTGVNDSVYKLYDAGNLYKICDGGNALLDPTSPLGASFRGANDIIAARNADGSDIIESYSFNGYELSKTATLYTNAVSEESRAARPIVDVNGAAFLWHEGTYTSTKVFSTSAKLMLLDSDLTHQLPEVELSETELIYNGEVQKPTVTVEGSDEYTLTWSDENSTEIGSYTVTVTFTGDNPGSVTFDYSIIADPYLFELDAPYAGKIWGEWEPEGGFCQNTRVTLKAAAPADSGAWVGVYQASESDYTETVPGQKLLAWDYVTATSLEDENATLNLAKPLNGTVYHPDYYLNGGCYKAVLFKDVEKTNPSKEIVFFIQGGHIFADPTYTWADDNLSVTASRECTGCDLTETETVAASKTAETAATCTAEGSATYTSEEFTNSAFAVQTAEIVIPQDPDAHDYDDPVYEWEEDGSKCTATAACKREGCGHVETEDAVVTSAVKTAATCTAKGTTTYTATFTNDLFETQSKDLEDIAIDETAHDYGTPSYEWAEDNSKCTATVICNNDKDHVVTEEVNTTSAVKTPATCTEKGTTTYTATFTNALFESQTKDVEDIDALEHDYDAPVYEWEEDGSKCTATATCKREGCGHKETEEVDTTSAEKTAATCTAKGTTTYTATFTNALFESQTKDVEDIEALGHDYDAPVYTWTEDGSKCTATATCKREGCGHEETEEAAVTSKEKTAATCTAKGTTTYTATFTNALFESQTKDVEDIAALGHDYQLVPDSSVGPTCTEAGKEADKECSRCHDKTPGAEIAALGHDPEKVEAKAATKDAEGNIEYYKCKKCGKFFKDAECKTEISEADTVVPKLEPTAEEKAAAEAKDNLNKVVEDAKKIGQGNYTDESFKALQDAIAAAETLAKDEKATAEQLKAAADKVTAAKAALKEKAAAPVAPAPAVADGQTEVISGSTVEVTSAADKEVAFKKARKGSKATVPATVSINGESYKVTSVAARAFKGRGTKSVVIGKNVKKLDKNAFYGSTVTTVTLKTKVLTRAKVKGSLKGSKVKTIKVKVGGKAQNKKFVKKYKPYFTKANAGKAATVK